MRYLAQMLREKKNIAELCGLEFDLEKEYKSITGEPLEDDVYEDTKNPTENDGLEKRL